MLTRVLALLLTVALLWSGHSGAQAQHVHAQALPGHQVTQVDGSAPTAWPESPVEHHAFDAQPAPALVDAPVETPGLLMAPVTTSAQALGSTRPCTWARQPAASPCLAGPLRPPCCTAFAG